MNEDYEEEVYNQYYDSAGNLYYIGTKTGEHVIRVQNDSEIKGD